MDNENTVATSNNCNFVPIGEEEDDDRIDNSHVSSGCYQCRDDDGSENKEKETDSFERKDDTSLSQTKESIATMTSFGTGKVSTKKLNLPVFLPKQVSDRQQMNSASEIDKQSEHSRFEDYNRATSEAFDAFEIS
jgi:hypothetical protein